jgi:hypothetical protein
MPLWALAKAMVNGVSCRLIASKKIGLSFITLRSPVLVTAEQAVVVNPVFAEKFGPVLVQCGDKRARKCRTGDRGHAAQKSRQKAENRRQINNNNPENTL